MVRNEIASIVRIQASLASLPPSALIAMLWTVFVVQLMALHLCSAHVIRRYVEHSVSSLPHECRI